MFVLIGIKIGVNQGFCGLPIGYEKQRNTEFLRRSSVFFWLLRCDLNQRPVAVPKKMVGRRGAPPFFRPRPLARLPFSATGGGRLTPLREPIGRWRSIYGNHQKSTPPEVLFRGAMHRNSYTE